MPVLSAIQMTHQNGEVTKLVERSLSQVSGSKFFEYRDNHIYIVMKSHESSSYTQDANFVVVIDGYLLQCPTPSDNDSDYIRELLQQNFSTQQIAQKLDGTYNIFIYSVISRHLTVITSRHSEIPLYYLKKSSVSVFSTSLLLVSSFSDKKIYDPAIFDMFNYCYVCSDDTYLQDVKCFPPGSTFANSCLNVYWDYQVATLDDEKNIDYEFYLQSLKQYLFQSLRSYFEKFNHFIVPISGGLDSRCILTILSALEKNDDISAFHTILTDFEKRCVQQISQVTEKKVQFNKLTSNFLEEIYQIYENTTDGGISFHQTWITESFLRFAKNATNIQNGVILDGYMLDVKFGDTYLQYPNGLVHPDSAVDVIDNLWSVKFKGYEHLFMEKEFLSAAQTNKKRRIQEAVNSLQSKPISRIVQEHYLKNRGTRYTLGAATIHRNFAEIGFPGNSFQLSELAQTLPQKLRVWANLYRDVQVKINTRVGECHWAKTHSKMNQEPNQKLMRFHKYARGIENVVTRLTKGKLDLLPYYYWDKRFRKDKRFRQFSLDKVNQAYLIETGILKKGGLDKLVSIIDQGYSGYHMIEFFITMSTFYNRCIKE